MKTNADVFTERYEARLVTKGNSQVEGADYEETYLPVVRLNLKIHQMDAVTAFLQGETKGEEEI